MRTHAIIGAGQVGRRLARSLIGNGESVRVVSRRGTSLDGARSFRLMLPTGNRCWPRRQEQT